MKLNRMRIPAFIISLCMILTAVTGDFDGGVFQTAVSVRAAENTSSEKVVFHVTLDPGHGGDDSGAEGNGRSEKDLTLKLAKMIKEELEKYDNITVGLTRKKDKYISLKKRTQRAVKQNADLMVSLHFDSYDPSCAYSSGCSAIVPKKGSYRSAIRKEGEKAARSILTELSKIGVTNRGLIRRLSAEGETYPDGSLADYYGIIRRGVLNKLPSILVEHSFIDSDHDFYNFLDTDEKLHEMAKADARGIARYLRLKNKKTGKVLKPSKDNGKTLVCYAKEGSYLSIRDKSYQLAQSRKSEGYDEVKNEEEETEVKKPSTTKNGQEETGKEDTDTDRAASLTDLTNRRTASIWLTAVLAAMLLLYYLLVIINESRESRGQVP